MHIAPYDNNNKPIVDIDDPTVPLNYFNIIKLKKGEAFEYAVPGYETCIVPATGTVDIEIEGFKADALGNRGEDVWDGEPEGVYVPTAAKASMVCTSDSAEVFVAGARYDKVLEAFAVRSDALDKVQYGSDDTKTHRKIKHILGQKQHDKGGRLLVLTRRIISASSPITGPACRCFSAKMASRVMRIIWSMARRFVWTMATIPVPFCPAMRCITSPFWAGCLSGHWCSSSSHLTNTRSRPFPASRT